MIDVEYDASGRPRPERAWLDQQTQHALIDLERKYGDIPWLPLALPCITPDDPEQFNNYFLSNAASGKRLLTSYDEPYTKETHPEGLNSSWHKPYWNTLEIYRGPRADEWFGSDSFETLSVDGATLFPKMYQQIHDLMPFKELFFIRFWSNQRPVGLHRDQDWTYNIPMSCRALIHDENQVDTFYTAKTRNHDGERHYVHLPSDTNSFAFNNGAFWHGADYQSKHKILMVVSGIPDLDKLERLLSDSVQKYSPTRVYNNMDHYIVYNITSKTQPTSPHSLADIYALYALLLTSPEVVNVEEHATPDGARTELRVIFWNQEAYYKFATRNQVKYQAIIDKLDSNYIGQSVEFARHTTTDGYTSEFAYKKYWPATQLIDWTLIDFHKNWFVENILPLGKVVHYNGRGQYENAPVYSSRFLKTRTSDIQRLLPNKKSMENFPIWMTYSFEHALEHAIGQHPYVYHRFIKLCHDVEDFAQKYIVNCEHSAVLIGHESLGAEINPHTHRLSDDDKLTLTIMVRITFDDAACEIKFYPPRDPQDPKLEQYYQHTDILVDAIQDQSPETIVPTGRASVLLFNAGYTPHTVNYNKDIYLFFVYDHVTFHHGMLDEIQNQSQQTKFTQQPKNKQVYFFDLPVDGL